MAAIEHRDETFVEECIPILASNDVTVLPHFRSLPDTKPFSFADGVSGGKKVILFPLARALAWGLHVSYLCRVSAKLPCVNISAKTLHQKTRRKRRRKAKMTTTMTTTECHLVNWFSF